MLRSLKAIPVLKSASPTTFVTPVTPVVARNPIASVALFPAASALLPLLLWCSGPLSAAASAPQVLDQVLQGGARISGRVNDVGGAPLAGALVAVQSVGEAFREHLVVTDRTGVFSIPGLVAGEYMIRVTKTRFLPAVAIRVEVQPGSSAVLTVNLQTVLDVARQGFRRGSMEDMKWVLRSSPSARPVLHLVQSPAPADPGPLAPEHAPLDGIPSDLAGYVQLYSTVETSSGAAESVGSEFAFNMPVAGDTRVTLSGQYSEAHGRPRGFAASYAFALGEGKQSSLDLSVRHGALLEGEYGRQAREIQIGYRESVQWSDNVVLSYGAAIGRSEGPAESHGYLRPELTATWVPRSGTVLAATFSRRAPTDAGDPIRGREYFDRAVYIPAGMEHYSHVEVGASQLVSGNTWISVAGFRDVLGAQAFLVSAGGAKREAVLVDDSRSPTSGMRFTLDRTFRGFEAGVVYTYGNALVLDPAPSSMQPAEGATRDGLHMVTARVKTDIALTQTTVTAVYRWVSGLSLAPIDPYQRFSEYNDPTLSITVAQDLPGFSILPASLQAIVDARNVLEPSFGSGRPVNAAYPRLLKGGIHIRF